MSSETQATRRITFLDTLHNREFRAMYIAQALSMVGNQLALVSVAILLYSRTHSALLSALTYAVGYAPWVLGGPVLAAYADRRPRRSVMVFCDAIRTGLVLLLIVPRLPTAAILLLLFLVAVLDPPFTSARAAMVPDVVGEGLMYAASANLSNLTNQFGVVVGLALGGVLVSVIGVHASLGIDAATFALSAGLIQFYVHHRPAAVDGTSTWLADLREGATVVFHDARLRWLVLMSWLVVGSAIATYSVAVPYSRSHGRGALTAGLLAAALPFGGVVGAIVVGRMLPLRLAEPLMLPMALLTPVILAVTATDPRPSIAGPLWVAAGVMSAMSLTANRVFVASVAREVRGRAFGIAVAGLMGAQGLGALAAGLLAEHVGPARAVADIALPVFAVMVLVSLTSSFRPEQDQPMNSETTAQDEDTAMPASARRPAQRVWALNAVLVLAAVLAAVAVRHQSAYLAVHISAWWIFGLLLIGMAYPLTIEFRRHSMITSLETVPLVLGMYFFQPLVVIGIYAGAMFVTRAIIRRQPIVRWIFNTASVALCTSAALAIFRLLAPHEGSVHIGTWLGTFAGAIASELISVALVSIVASFNDNTWRMRESFSVLQIAIPVDTVATFLAIVAAAAIAYDPHTAWAITVFLVLSIAAMQIFHRLSQRAEALDRLYAVAREMGPMAADPADLAPALTQLRRIMRANELELSVTTSADRSFATVVSVFDDEAAGGEGVSVIKRAVDEEFEASLDPRFDARFAWLPRSRRSSRRESNRLSTRVWAGDRPLGILTARGRTDETATFERSDLHLLEAASDQLATALEKGRLVESLRRAATRDTLTGLANLESLRSFLATMLDTGTGGVLLLFDIDRFHDVNDMLGHDAGDAVLVEVARRLESSPSHGALAARVGSDQFALAIPGAAGSEVARLAALAVKSRVDGSLRFAEVSADVRVTVGVARSPDHGPDAPTLLRRAEMAMTVAKGTSAGIGEWEPSYERDGSRRLQLLAGLRAALAEGALRVEYQPKIRLGGGEVTGFEALVRWRHPELGPVSPDEFVPLAEATGLISALTSTVLRTALTTCRTWHDAGKPVGIAVNISARSLDDPVLVGQVAAMLTASGLEPRWLTLEITESSVMENHERSLEVLRQLRMLGVRLSIDDFGTGYSSLHQLKGLPVHEVKIDRSFVEVVDGDGADRAVVRAVVELCVSLGLTSVAEGVEKASQAYALESLGVDQVQGFFHSRPMVPSAAMEWLLPRRVAGIPINN
jgi:diguanylate cyclase (GGDEF)-like protein